MIEYLYKERIRHSELNYVKSIRNYIKKYCSNQNKIIELQKEIKNNSARFLFEGEYLDGKRNGRGKEYHDNKELKFEGELEKNGMA